MTRPQTEPQVSLSAFADTRVTMETMNEQHMKAGEAIKTSRLLGRAAEMSSNLLNRSVVQADHLRPLHPPRTRHLASLHLPLPRFCSSSQLK